MTRDFLQIRSFMVCSYLLHDKDGVVLIDGGFLGGIDKIHTSLKSIGLDWPDVRAILMTHGHLDHTINVARLRELTGASVYGNKLDEKHFAGAYAYKGLARLCGAAEWLGRCVLGYNHFQPDFFINDGDVLDLWGGLKVIHLPGHTAGHCGFYSSRLNILFSGDSHANYGFRVIQPWPWLNSCPKLIRDSLDKIITLGPNEIWANHCDHADGRKQRARFMKKFG